MNSTYQSSDSLDNDNNNNNNNERAYKTGINYNKGNFVLAYAMFYFKKKVYLKKKVLFVTKRQFFLQYVYFTGAIFRHSSISKRTKKRNYNDIKKIIT